MLPNMTSDFNIDLTRLQNRGIEGPGVTLAYMADDRVHVCTEHCVWVSILTRFTERKR